MVLSVSIVTGFDRYFCKGCYTKLEKKEEKTSLTYSLVNLTKSFEIVFVWYRNRLGSLVRGYIILQANLSTNASVEDLLPGTFQARSVMNFSKARTSLIEASISLRQR